MAVKQQHPLTKEDFETVIVTLRLSVSEVARETGIPRHIVSHFRNYGDGLKPEQAAKLRDWLESKGVEFADEENAEAAQVQTASAPVQKLPMILSDDGLTQRTALVCRHFFIDERISDDQITETINGLYKTELIHKRAPWKTKEAVELATLEWVSWFNNHRLLESIGYIPPAEAEGVPNFV